MERYDIEKFQIRDNTLYDEIKIFSPFKTQYNILKLYIFRIKSIDDKTHDICMVHTYEECIVFTVYYVTEN